MAKRKRQRDTGGQQSDPAWQAIADKYPDNPALQAETIYALPPSLIDAITATAPGVLTDADERFERDLTAAAPCGFHQQLRFGYPPLLAQSPTKSQPRAELASVQRSVRNIKAMLHDDMLERGVSEAMAAEYFAYGDSQRERWGDRRWSYAGWVATCPEFRRERDTLRRRYPIAKPPSLPISFTGVTDDQAHANETSRAWFVFLRRWGLEALATWELPVPMRAELTEPALYSYEHLSEAGMHLFIPWYLLRDKDIRLYELAERNGLSAMPQPLQNWFGGESRNWGHRRNRQMLLLYVYWELVLRRRYPKQIARKTAQLDEAFARFWRGETSSEDLPADESQRKLRLAMCRRLKD